MASSKKSMAASPVLLFVAMALMLAACTEAQAPAPAPAPSQGSCPPGFKNYLDLTDFLRSVGREALMIVDPSFVSDVRSIISLIPHTGLQLCVCVDTKNATSPLPIQCLRY